MRDLPATNSLVTISPLNPDPFCPWRLLADANTLLRSLRGALQDCAAHPVAAAGAAGVVGALAQEGLLLDPHFSAALGALVAEFGHAIADDMIDEVEIVTVGVDDDGVCYAERPVRRLSDAAAPLVALRDLAAQIAARVDRVHDLLDAEVQLARRRREITEK